MRHVLLAAAALTMASSAAAGAPGELDCIAASYSAEERSEVDALLPLLDVTHEDRIDAFHRLGQIVDRGAGDCAAAYAWSDGALEAALLFELGRLMEVAIRRNGPFQPSEIARIDALLAKGDRAQLWAVMEAQFALSMEGAKGEVSDANAAVMNHFLAETGLATDDATAEQVGAYLVAKAMQRMYARAFAAQ